MYLNGDFSILSPASLIQSLCHERRPVTITAWHHTSIASIHLADGVVLGATCDALEDAEAIYYVATWEHGHFSVVPLEDVPDATLGAGPEELLLEAARRRDERTELPESAVSPLPAQQTAALLHMAHDISRLLLIGYDGRLLSSVGTTSTNIPRVTEVALALADAAQLAGNRVAALQFTCDNMSWVMVDSHASMFVVGLPNEKADLRLAQAQLTDIAHSLDSLTPTPHDQRRARIYTRTGDSGETGLYGGRHVAKDDTRIHACGTIDELNALIGVVRCSSLDTHLDQVLARVQDHLFVLGGDVATPLDDTHILRVTPDMIGHLESMIGGLDIELEPLRQFILPMGTMGASQLHLARTVCRRAERWIVSLSHTEQIGPYVIAYVNRLSDLLFVMARIANSRMGVPDTLWSSNGKTVTVDSAH